MEFRRYISVGLAIVLWNYSALASSSGLADIFQQKHVSYTDIQWPVVKNGSNEILGIFGGISPAHNQDGGQESATLAILESGYIIPILENGSIATFPVVYFTEEECEGREYYPVSGPLPVPGLLPVRGLIYSSLVSKSLVYISRHEESVEILAGSRLSMNENGNIECVKLSNRLRVLEAIRNSTEITGVSNDNKFHLVSVDVGSLRNKQQVKNNPASNELLNIPGDADYLDDADILQEECSPGCLLDSVGNGNCDTECYVEACFHDQGDCEAVDPVKLQKMLSDMCSPGCFSADIGDSFCDAACNTQACQFDDGDCKDQ